jgi:hypothetical protein
LEPVAVIWMTFSNIFLLCFGHTAPAVWMCAGDQEKDESGHHWNTEKGLQM